MYFHPISVVFAIFLSLPPALRATSLIRGRLSNCAINTNLPQKPKTRCSFWERRVSDIWKEWELLLLAGAVAAAAAVLGGAAAVGTADALDALLFGAHQKHHAAGQHSSHHCKDDNIYRIHRLTSFRRGRIPPSACGRSGCTARSAHRQRPARRCRRRWLQKR